MTAQSPGDGNHNASNVASVSITVGGALNAAPPLAAVTLSVIGKGTGTAALTIDGVSYPPLSFQPYAGQEWSTPTGERIEHSVLVGESYNVHVTSSGLTDFVVRARISSWVNPSDRYAVQCGGAYVDSITKGELQNDSFDLSVVRTWAAPFGSIDLSDLPLKGVIRYGLGSNRVGQPAGYFANDGLVKGPGVEWSNNTPGHLQARVPAGFVDRSANGLSFYPDGNYPFNGQFYDLSSATPLVTYSWTSLGLTRTSGGVTMVMEFGYLGQTTTESAHDGPYPYGPPENNWTIETWDETTTWGKCWWPWRAPGTPRGGMSESIKTSRRTAQIIGPAGSQGPINYTDQPFYVEIKRHWGPDASDPTASYEKHSFPIGEMLKRGHYFIIDM